MGKIGYSRRLQRELGKIKGRICGKLRGQIMEVLRENKDLVGWGERIWENQESLAKSEREFRTD